MSSLKAVLPQAPAWVPLSNLNDMLVEPASALTERGANGRYIGTPFSTKLWIILPMFQFCPSSPNSIT
eukprot:5011779-Prorocentrum_lima.AAC.1